METVTVVDGTRKDTGWFEFELADGRKVATKARPLADALYQSKGSDIGVDITTKKNGNFVNHYVNAVDGVEDTRKKSDSTNGATAESAVLASTTIPAAPSKDARLASQWAVGRAVELTVAGLVEKDAIEATALELLGIAREIEKGL